MDLFSTLDGQAFPLVRRSLLFKSPVEDLLDCGLVARSPGKSEIGVVAADNRRNVNCEEVGPDGSGHQIGDSRRQRVPVVAQVGMHHVAAMQVDAQCR